MGSLCLFAGATTASARLRLTNCGQEHARGMIYVLSIVRPNSTLRQLPLTEPPIHLEEMDGAAQEPEPPSDRTRTEPVDVQEKPNRRSDSGGPLERSDHTAPTAPPTPTPTWLQRFDSFHTMTEDRSPSFTGLLCSILFLSTVILYTVYWIIQWLHAAPQEQLEVRWSLAHGREERMVGIARMVGSTGNNG